MISQTPSRCARGAYISSVSCAMARRRSGDSGLSVRMLCSLSASLISTTRTSDAMDTSILRMLAACASPSSGSWGKPRPVSSIKASVLVSLVTPSTRRAISMPNCRSMASMPTSQSSTTSCSSAAASALESRRRSARNSAVWSGCSMNGSPDFRTCPSCAWAAKQYALSMMSSRFSGK